MKHQAINTFISILRILRKSSISCRLPVLPQGKTDIYILGNGPSLGDSLIDSTTLLQSNDCMCVNFFADSKLFEVIKPSYYVFLDPVFWEENCRGQLIESRDRVYSKINNAVSWKITLLFPMYAKRALDLENLFSNNNIEVCFFNSSPLSGFKHLTYWLYKNNLGMPHAQNVLVAAIFIAINIGYKQIFLLGADHSWHEDIVLNAENIVCHKNKHFYDDKDDTKLLRWEKGDNSGGTLKMHEILMALAKMFEGYQALEEYSKYRNASIYNASAKTYIDAFTRRSL